MSIQSIGVRSVFVTRTAWHALWIIAVGLITLYHTAAMQVAGATTIDNFSQPNLGTQFYVNTLTTLPAFTSAGNPVVVSNTNTLTLNDTVSPSTAIGGERNTTVNVVGTLTPDSVEGLIGAVGPSGPNGMQIGAHGTTLTSITSMYLPGGVSPTIDLTNGGTQKAVVVNVVSTDQPLSITANLSNSTQHWSYSTTAPVNYDSITKTFVPENITMPFRAFSGPAGAGTSVNQITFTYNGGASSLSNIDFTIGSITTTNTPEPGSAALLAIGLVAFGGMACRQARRQSAARKGAVREGGSARTWANGLSLVSSRQTAVALFTHDATATARRGSLEGMTPAIAVSL